MSKTIMSSDFRDELIMDLVEYRKASEAKRAVDAKLSHAVMELITDHRDNLESLKNLESILPADSSAFANVRTAMSVIQP
jgi:hypothetical protein